MSDIQARAILELRLQRLTGLERDKIREEYAELMKTIDALKQILASEDLRMDVIKKELTELKEKFGDKRRSEIVLSGEEMRMEDFIVDEDVVITISHEGYIKRTVATDYRRQSRGGRGSKGSASREADFIEHLFIASTHQYMLFFTEQGRCFWLKVYEIPEGSRTSKGRAIQNLIQIPKGDKVKAFINVKNLEDPSYLSANYIVMCTRKGTIKKTTLEAYSRPRANGINAITINEGDSLLEVLLTGGTSNIMMGLRSGRAIRFPEDTVRPMGRTAAGVRGVSLAGSEDEVIGMIAVPGKESGVLVVSEKGFGKRSEVDDYRITNRGGKGVKTINVTEKTGPLIAIKAVKDTEDLMIINRSGITIRISVRDLRMMGRNTQGVRLIRLGDDDQIASIAKMEEDTEEVELLLEQAGGTQAGPLVPINPDSVTGDRDDQFDIASGEDDEAGLEDDLDEEEDDTELDDDEDDEESFEK